MAKIKLTKGELKRQRDSLKQFQHYLPTLQLKKQQLQMKILEARRILSEKQKELQILETDIARWVGLLADPQLPADVNLSRWLTPTTVDVETINIAGANVPYLKDVSFPPEDYDLYLTPYWVDVALEQLRSFMKALVETLVIQKQIAILGKELRVTTQRVNLFEKIKIPEALDNIRKIRIYLGDQQANAVGISKVAKHKVELKVLLEVGV